jgi:hypothetical protein
MNVELTEDRVPIEGIETSISELVEMYGGEIRVARDGAREITLPLRRGVATAGAVECTVSWTEDETVTMLCDRDVDAPRPQRVMLLVAGVIGAVLFMLWPFFPNEREMGALAWIGGAVAIAVYVMTLRRTSGGIAADFLQRLAARQRSLSEPS